MYLLVRKRSVLIQGFNLKLTFKKYKRPEIYHSCLLWKFGRMNVEISQNPFNQSVLWDWNRRAWRFYEFLHFKHFRYMG